MSSKNHAIVKKFGDKTEFTIARFLCITNEPLSSMLLHPSVCAVSAQQRVIFSLPCQYSSEISTCLTHTFQNALFWHGKQHSGKKFRELLMFCSSDVDSELCLQQPMSFVYGGLGNIRKLLRVEFRFHLRLNDKLATPSFSYLI